MKPIVYEGEQKRKPQMNRKETPDAMHNQNQCANKKRTINGKPQDRQVKANGVSSNVNLRALVLYHESSKGVSDGYNITIDRIT